MSYVMEYTTGYRGWPLLDYIKSKTTGLPRRFDETTCLPYMPKDVRNTYLVVPGRTYTWYDTAESP